MSYHLLSKTLTTAKKPHTCVWCCFPTIVGSKYIREHSIYDGQHQNHAWHEACWAAAQAYFAETQEEEFISGNDMPFLALYKLEAATP